MGWINFIATVIATIAAYKLATYYANKIAQFIIPIPYNVLYYLGQLPRMTQLFTKKAYVAFSMVEAIVLFFTMLFFLWLFNTIVIQLNISLECSKFNGDSLRISAINALGGAISAAIIVLVWNIITSIPFPLTKILLIIEGLPVIGALVIPILLLIFNLSFGAGVGNAVAISQACTTTNTTTNTTPPSTTTK